MHSTIPQTSWELVESWELTSLICFNTTADTSLSTRWRFFWADPPCEHSSTNVIGEMLQSSVPAGVSFRTMFVRFWSADLSKLWITPLYSTRYTDRTLVAGKRLELNKRKGGFVEEWTFLKHGMRFLWQKRYTHSHRQTVHTTHCKDPGCLHYLDSSVRC